MMAGLVSDILHQSAFIEKENPLKGISIKTYLPHCPQVMNQLNGRQFNKATPANSSHPKVLQSKKILLQLFMVM